MYTGIVESTGRLRAIDRSGTGARGRVGSDLDGIEPDDSVAVSGVCLTAVEVGEDWFATDLSTETLERTYLGDAEPGTAVNLERPVPVDGRLDGHVLRGAIDATTEVVSVTEADESWIYTVATPPEHAQLVVEKGAMGLDGVSLTVAATGRATFDVAVVPRTRAATTLDRTQSGDPLHVEADVPAKYARARTRPESTGTP